MSEYMDLIQKEKKEALQDYREELFRTRLDRKISAENQLPRPYVSWFQKPAIAGSTVLLILLFGWLSTQIFLPSSQTSDAVLLKNTFVQLFSQHGTILNQNPLPVEPGDEKLAIYEFEWSLKRVIFAIQRENAPDEDMAQNLSQVLLNTASLIKAEKSKSGEMNI